MSHNDDSKIPTAHRAAEWIYQQGEAVGTRELQQGLGLTGDQAKAAMRRILEQAEVWIGMGGYQAIIAAGQEGRPALRLRITRAPRLPNLLTVTEQIAAELRRTPHISTRELRERYNCSKTLVCNARHLLRHGQTPRRKKSHRGLNTEHQRAVRQHKTFLAIWPRPGG